MQARLTAALVRRLAETDPPVRDTVYFDTQLPRFALRVMPPRQPGGPWASAYVVQYRNADGVSRRLRIGAPSSMGLDDARKAARKALGDADKGGDPAAERKTARAAWTVRDAAEAYLASREHKAKTESTQKGEQAMLHKHVTHRLGTVKLGALDVPVLKRFLKAVEADTRTNSRQRRLGGRGAARKAVRTLSALLSWAVGEGQLERNPIIGAVRLDGDAGREAVIDTPEHYASLFTTMDALVTGGDLGPLHRAFFTVAAATGMRRGELRGLRWGQVDLVERRIIILASKGSKLARSGPKGETVSLPAFAAAALAAIRPQDAAPDALVFPPSRGAQLSVNREWNKVRKAAGLPPDLVLHGLRHSAGTVAVLSGLSALEVQKMLRHRNLSTTQRYIHLADRSRLTDRAMDGFLPGGAAGMEPGGVLLRFKK